MRYYSILYQPIKLKAIIVGKQTKEPSVVSNVGWCVDPGLHMSISNLKSQIVKLDFDQTRVEI